MTDHARMKADPLTPSALPLSEQMREWLKDAWHKPYCRFGHMRWRIVGKHLVQDGQEDCTCGLSALLKE